MMLNNLFKQFLKKAMYAAIGAALTWATVWITNFHPVDPQIKAIWESVGFALATGLVAAIGRLIGWNPEKAKK